jgi:Ser/Thr protein kinase RdoA (MazF antagonist)
MLANVLQQYNININRCVVKPFGSGLINSTWKIICGDEQYIVQKINHAIFKQPQYIAANIRLLADYLGKMHAGFLFVAPVTTTDNREIVIVDGDGYYRMFPFIQNSHTIDVVTNAQQAYEAAKQFAAFTKRLAGFNAADLKITLPDFHNLSLRYQQFEQALQNGNRQRIQATITQIEVLKMHKDIVDRFEKIKASTDFKLRVTHHDTKISNVLFDEKNNGLCVIDLDTVMPGYFISDVGDMLRTYLSPASEEESDFTKIKIRGEYLDAIIKGYLSEMEDELTETEKQSFIYAGEFMIYMQALRFFTDYLNNDVYYGSKYEGHNLVRAKNQMVLLQLLKEKQNLAKL